MIQFSGAHDPGTTAAVFNKAFLERSLARARQLMLAGRHAEAAGLLSPLRSASGSVGCMARRLRAEALLHLGRFDEAEQEADAAVAAADTDVEILKLRARMRLSRGNTLGAADDAAAAVMQAPSDPQAMGLLGVALLSLDQLLEATYLLGRAVQVCPENEQYSLWLGRAYIQAGKHEAAEEVLRFSSSLAPRAVGPWVLRAQNALAMGDAPRAAAIAEEAVRMGLSSMALHSALGHALIRQGRRDEAGTAFARAARLAPDNGYLAHLSNTALGLDTDRASDGYVTAIFDGYASRFEYHLLSLGYRVPGLMLRLVQEHFRRQGQDPDRAKLGPVLDLGCGTGMVGLLMSDLIGDKLVGVDPSSEMLSFARAKGLYTELRQQEITAALGSDDARYDLVVSADVLVYFGRLDHLFRLCAGHLADGGCLMFSVEAGRDNVPGWQLQGNGRYAHSRRYIEASLTEAGLAVSEFLQEVLRHEAGRPVMGHVVVATKRTL